MIEAVNTSQAVSQLRVPPQAATVMPVSANLATSQSVSFISSRIRVDTQADLAILEFRSNQTGDVIRQYPTENQIRAIQRAAELETRQTDTVRQQVDAEQARVEQQLASFAPAEKASAPKEQTAPAPQQSAPAPSSNEGTQQSSQSILV